MAQDGIGEQILGRNLAAAQRMLQSSGPRQPVIVMEAAKNGCPFHKLELYEIGELPVLPQSSVGGCRVIRSCARV